MADYWKSQAKKFCDFCKCWIADNKPSVEFHEKGKRHKENVEKRLKEIGQKSQKEYKETLKVDCEMKKMEEAAMKAYLKDVEGDGDFTSQLIKQELREKEEKMRKERETLADMVKGDLAGSSGASKKEERTRKERVGAEEGDPAGRSGVKEDAESFVPWYEATSEEGHTYYWHVETGEAVWEPPEEGFVSKAVQEEKAQAERETEEKRKKQEERLEAIKKAEEGKEREEEERARLAREKMRSRAAKKEKKEIVPFEPVAMGPAPKPDPYGGWKTVERYEENPVDLQLPKQNYAEVFVPTIVDTAPKFKIREKTIGSLDAEGSGDFKKRKINGSSRRNARQRLDDQD